MPYKKILLLLVTLVFSIACQTSTTAPQTDLSTSTNQAATSNPKPEVLNTVEPNASSLTPASQELTAFFASLMSSRQSPAKVMSSRRIGELSNFPVDYNERVEKWLRHFTAHDGKTLQEWLKRARPYTRMIKEALAEDGLPAMLFYVPLIESGFVSNARSPKAAAGPWQFMRGTAQLYKLTMDEWIDERHDPISSTHAASHLLKNLYSDYQDWYLALAAYNAGPGRINRALLQVKTKSYWALVNSSAVKAETKDYVPKLLAVMMIAENPKAFGLSWENDGGDSNLPYTYIELNRPLEITAIEKELLLPRDTIKKWNPKLLSNITPPTASRENPFRLKIHVDHASKLYASLEHLPSFQVDYVKTHHVVSGDTLASIARHYGASLKNILKLNPNLQAQRLKIGRNLLIPIRNPKLAASQGILR